MKKLLFVYNPHSGTGKISKKLNKILKVFKQAGYETEAYATKAPLDGRNKLLRDGKDFDRLVVAGGDGMLNELVGAIMESSYAIEVGYLPTGTANDFARSHGISKNPIKAAKTAVSDNIKSVDVGKFNDRYFCYVAATGFGTKASYLTDQKAKNHWKFLAYLNYVLKDLNRKGLKNSCRKMTVTTDDGIIEGEYVFAAVSNSFSIGGMKNLTDRTSVLDDGKLEGLFLPLPTNLKRWRILLKAFFTRNYKLPGLTFTTSQKFEISSETSAWSLDGENGGEHEKLTITACPRALKIALPSKKRKQPLKRA